MTRERDDLLSVRIPGELKTRIGKIATERGESLSDFVVKFLSYVSGQTLAQVEAMSKALDGADAALKEQLTLYAKARETYLAVRGQTLALQVASGEKAVGITPDGKRGIEVGPNPFPPRKDGGFQN
jgi:hypothetical protein